MPTTRENVAWLHNRNPKFSAQQILEFLNEVHMKCVHQEIDQFLYRDPATGMPPFLQTTEGTRVYNCPSNCRKTSKIFVDLYCQKYHYTSMYNNRRVIDNVRLEEFEWGGERFYYLPWISQTDALVSAGVLATVTWGANYDPGTTTNQYYHLFWIKCNQILTLDDEMQLPDELHFGIRKMVSAYMATEDYGESQSDEDVMIRIARDVRNRLDIGARGRVGRTQWQIKDRDW